MFDDSDNEHGQLADLGLLWSSYSRVCELSFQFPYPWFNMKSACVKIPCFPAVLPVPVCTAVDLCGNSGLGERWQRLASVSSHSGPVLLLSYSRSF